MAQLHWADEEEVKEILRKSNIINISNNIFAVSRCGASLVFAGIDSAMIKKDRLDVVLQKMPVGASAILLAHGPDFVKKSAPTGRFGLQLWDILTEVNLSYQN